MEGHFASRKYEIWNYSIAAASNVVAKRVILLAKKSLTLDQLGSRMRAVT